MSKKIVIVAGEASGDAHSASLIQALKNINPDLEISGMGGEKMRSAGARIQIDLAELAIIGFTDVLANFKKIKTAFKQLLAEIDSVKPAAVILVDYPGFNLKLAKEIKKRNIPVIYYISPQIWAWWPGRIKNIKRCVDKMIVLFEFEQKLYQDHGIDATFVGHPLLDSASVTTSKDEFLKKLGLTVQKKTIGLIPGSRKMEVERILPILLESARLIKNELPAAQFIVLKARGLAKEIFQKEVAKHDFPLPISENQTYDFLNACDFALVASGTATLETAIMQTPMLIVYKVSFLNWLIARMLIRLPYIGLVNVVAQKKIVPEFVQFQARPKDIAACALATLTHPQALTTVKQQLGQVRQRLGAKGATELAAQAILNYLA
ncbi:lipid-A-disaccharide synthase [Candidatus Omnitrophota bacterium]